MIFSNNRNNDLEYNLEKNYILGLRSTLMEDEDFTYNVDPVQSKVIITTDYPDKEMEFKTPQIVVTGISYSISDTSLSNNYTNAIIKEVDGERVNVGERYVTVVPYGMSLICFASNSSLSKDLANKLVNLLKFEACDFFNHELNLNIKSISKGTTSMYNSKPNQTFMTPVSINGDIHWVGEKYYKTPNYLKNLSAILRTVSNEDGFYAPFDEDKDNFTKIL